jgi:hypothetical protein
MNNGVIPEEIITQLTAYLGVREEKYDYVVLLDGRYNPAKLVCFPLKTALEDIEREGCVPEDGKVYLIDSKSSWGKLIEAMRQADKAFSASFDESKES